MDLQNKRILFFLGIFLILIFLEYLSPMFKHQKYKKHIKENILLFLFSILTLKIAFPFGLFALADKFISLNIGVLKLHSLPYGIDLLFTIIIFDLAIYIQHRLFHKVPFLWNSHKVHHSDTEMDLTTAVRFHPVEIFLSALYKIMILYILTPRVEIFILYEICLNGFALFTHANLNIHKKIDHYLRWIIVTPSMHFPHHSPNMRLTNTNYGNILSVWDKLFKTYTMEENRIFGLESIKSSDSKNILSLMKMAFKK